MRLFTYKALICKCECSPYNTLHLVSTLALSLSHFSHFIKKKCMVVVFFLLMTAIKRQVSRKAAKKSTLKHTLSAVFVQYEEAIWALIRQKTLKTPHFSWFCLIWREKQSIRHNTWKAPHFRDFCLIRTEELSMN